jgi:hypothetical protein
MILLHGKYEGIYTTERENNIAARVLHFSFAADGHAKPCKHPHTENNPPPSWDNALNNGIGIYKSGLDDARGLAR